MEKLQHVGKRYTRPDSLSKVTGAAKYTSDLVVSRKDILLAKALFPPYGHARILELDVSLARALPGVAIVMTAADLPGENRYGGMMHDKPVIAENEVIYEGDPVALVAAVDLATAEKAISLIRVRYEPLPAYDDPCALLAADAPRIHCNRPFHQESNISDEVLLQKGNTAAAFAKADIILDNVYETPMLDHAYLEPDACLAEPDPVQGGIVLYSPQHAVHLAAKALCEVFALPQSKIRVVSQVVGGGFGGKEDSTFDVSAVAGVLCLKTGRPVFYEFTRAEVFKNTGKRHAASIHHRLAASRDGRILAIEVDTVVDKGAYKSIDAIPSRTAQYAGGPYSIDNALCRSWSVFTNHPYGCAFRGLGAPQAHFAIESQMDELAEALHMDPIELRLKNILQPGDSTIFGQTMLAERGMGLESCILQVKERIGWEKPLDQSQPHIRRGRGIACFLYGTGTGFPTDGSHCFMQAQPDGSLSIGSSSNELGQGYLIAMRQIAADGLGVSLEKVSMNFSDTASSPDAGATVASRTTTFLGNAILDGCAKLKARLLPVAAELLHCEADSLEIREGEFFFTDSETPLLSLSAVVTKAFASQIPLAVVGSWYPPMTYPNAINQGDKMHCYTFGAQAVTVAVDVSSGSITVEDAVLACDVGKAINPDTVEGQLQGGMAQGIGWALMEEEFMKNGRMKNFTYHDYLIPTAMDLPPLQTILVEKPNCLGPYGAKGVGEPPVVGAAPAIRNAVKAALGLSLNTIPLTPVRVMDALRQAADRSQSKI